jgi:flagellar protein FliS
MNLETTSMPSNNESEAQPGGVKIILMLYDGAISYLQTASKYAQSGDVTKKNIYINKTLDILDELERNLDMELGGEIAQNLSRIYAFMRTHLQNGLDTKDTKSNDEVIKLLNTLRDSWQAVEDSMDGPDGPGPT